MGTSIGRKKRLSAADFLEALEARLAALKPAELRAALLAHAETFPAAERGAFLAIFEAGGETGKAGGKRRPGRATEAESLLRDIDALVEKYGASQHEGRGNDWEEEDGEEWDRYEPAQGTWPTAKIDALFERTDAAFREGDLAHAREAYEKLLTLVAGFGEEGFDADEEESEPVGATDLDEAKARYLRSLYETTEPAQRPAALLRALQDLQYVGGGPVGLPEVIGARRAALPDRDTFLEAWIELLRQGRADQVGFDMEARRLLFQAVRIHRGTEGLAELARRDGRRIPEAYRKWVQALAEESQTGEAVRAAQEALRALAPTGEIRAWIAEFIADAAEKNDDGAARLDARREAFRATPTLVRLSALCEAAEPVGELKTVVHAEAARLRSVVARQSRRKGQGEDAVELQTGHRFLATLLLLDGDTEEAIALAEQAPAVGWSGGEHPGPVVMPYLLCAAAGGAEPAPGTALAELWRGIDVDEPAFPMWDLDTQDDDFDDEPEAAWPDASLKPRPVRLTPFLRAQIARQPVDPDRQARFLEVAWTVAERRVKEILDKKHRGAYERAAMLVGAVSEARIMAGDAGGGHALLENTRQHFSRYSAFTRELDKIARRSPLLPSSPAKHRRW